MRDKYLGKLVYSGKVKSLGYVSKKITGPDNNEEIYVIRFVNGVACECDEGELRCMMWELDAIRLNVKKE